jgi:hypothetical protein
MIKVKLDGKEYECENIELVGYYATQFENGKINIFVKDMICTKANLHFRKPTKEEIMGE